MERIIGEYVYNGAGDRLAQTVNGKRTEYLLDASNPLTEVVGAFGAGDPTYYLLGLDVIGSQTDQDWSYFGYDGLGSTRFVTDSLGAMTSATRYDPYGGVLDQVSAVRSNLGFAGEFTDPNGLINLRARFYSPSLGTFLNRDPVLGQVGGMSVRWNPYIYAGGNPINNIDPDGQFFFGAALAGGVLGGGFDLGSQIVGNLLNGNSWNCNIDWGSVAMSALEGGLAGGLGLGMLGDFALGTGFDLMRGESLENALVNGVINTAVGFGTDFMVSGGGVRTRFNSMLDQGVNSLKRDLNTVGRARRGLNQAARRAMDSGSRLDVSRAARPRAGNGGSRASGGGSAPRRSRAAGCLANSFSEDTTISTSEGDVMISEIEQGDVVHGYDEVTGETGEYTVLDTIVHEDDTIAYLTIDGEVIETTPWHLFYTDEGWQEVEDLEAGDLILSLDERYGVVESVTIAVESQVMYDLTVEEVHTFAVGEGRWVVHNQEFPAPPWSVNRQGKFKGPRWNDQTRWRYTTMDDVTASGRLPSWFDTWFVDSTGRRMPNIDGRLPLSWQWAGRNISASWKEDNPLWKLAPQGVDFDLYGFPIFDPYAVERVRMPNLSGDWQDDFIDTNYHFLVESGRYTDDYLVRTAGQPQFWHTRVGYNNYTWHHLQDAETMLLVPQQLNERVKHTGGAKICRLRS